MKNECYPIIKQHFEQTDKIYKKMESLDDIVYCKKVKIIPTIEQISIIISWHLDTIEIYNDLVKEFNEIHKKIRRKYQKTDKTMYYGKYLATKLKESIEFPLGAKKLRDSKIHSLTEKYDLPLCNFLRISKEISQSYKKVK